MYQKVYPKFKDNICPLCGGIADTKGFDLYKPEGDAFHYRCSSCNPNAIIAITGSALASSFFTKVETDNYLRDALRSRVQSSTDEEVVIYQEYL